MKRVLSLFWAERERSSAFLRHHLQLGLDLPFFQGMYITASLFRTILLIALKGFRTADAVQLSQKERLASPSTL